MSATAIVVLGPGGLEVARRAAAAIPGAVVHGLRGRITQADMVLS